MSSFLDQLNEQQKEAVLTSSKYVRIIAGAGSGKTRVLTSRIVHLIEDLGVSAKSIVAITFTNKAANVMKERVQEMLQDKGAGVHISTIHSLCVSILRQDIIALNYPRNFTVMDTDDQKSVLKEAYKNYDIDAKKFSYASILDYISNNKYADISPERALTMAGGFPNEVARARAYEYYEKRRQELYALDFDDLLLVTVRLFDAFPETLKKWQNRFNFILVDEFQDIDATQYRLICQLAGKENDVYVVGDPDQTIYTWRGADINIIMNFDKQFPGAETIMMTRNYRSTANILSGANCIIRNNRNRLEKDLFTVEEEGDKIVHYHAASDEFEAFWVANKIQELHNQGTKFPDMAILYRANYLSRTLEKALMDAHIHYVIYGGLRFYERAEIKDALSYLRMISNADDLSFKRIINVPRRKIGQKSIDAIFTYAQDEGCSMFEAVSQKAFLKGAAQENMDAFVRMVEAWRQKEKEGMGISQLLETVIEDSGYRRMLEEDKEAERLENLKELIEDVHDFEIAYPESTLDEYLQMVNLYGDRAETSDGNAVQMMTVHAAKGMEFDTVFVCGLSESVFPSERTMAEGLKGLEEERRLAYVAFTRARKRLYLCESGGFSFQAQIPKTASRFIREIDEEYIEHIGMNFEYRNPVEEKLSEQNARYLDEGEIRILPSRRPKESAIKKGDLVEHAVFGSGVVISVKDGIMEIAFAYPHGIKKIMENHPSVTKKEVS